MQTIASVSRLEASDACSQHGSPCINVSLPTSEKWQQFPICANNEEQGLFSNGLKKYPTLEQKSN